MGDAENALSVIYNGELLLFTCLWSFWWTQLSFGRRITIKMEGGNTMDEQENK